MASKEILFPNGMVMAALVYVPDGTGEYVPWPVRLVDYNTTGAIDNIPITGIAVPSSSGPVAAGGSTPFITRDASQIITAQLASGLERISPIAAVEDIDGDWYPLHTSNHNLKITGAKLTPVSGLVNLSGDNDLITPSDSSKSIRLFYASYNPANPVECAFKFSAAGGKFFRNNVITGGSIIAKDMGTHYIQGNPNEKLILNLSAAVDTIWNALYTEI